MSRKKFFTLSVLTLLTLAYMNESSIALTVRNKTDQKITLSVMNKDQPEKSVDSTLAPKENETLQLPEDMIKSISKNRPLEIKASWYHRGETKRCTYNAHSEDERVSVQYLKDMNKLACIPE